MLIHCIKFNDQYENTLEKKTEIIETVESNYKILRRVYQSFFAGVTDVFLSTFIRWVMMNFQELDDDIKANGLGVILLLDIENAYELLTIFQMFYLNGRLPLTNGLLVVPNGKVPEGSEKINLKNLYEMFKDTHSQARI